MEGLTPPTNMAPEYHPMGSCESDDSQSSASRSDDNEALPGIIYTSDDSADVGQSDSTYVDSDIANYIAQNVNQGMEDELSQQFLLEPDTASPNASPRVDVPFISHPLSPINLSRPIVNQKESIQNCPKVNLQVNPVEGLGLTRSNSLSSSSTETEFTAKDPFLSHYEPLPLYPDDEAYSGGLNFDSLHDDPIKSKVIRDQLNLLANGKEIELNHQDYRGRYYVGNVHIDASYSKAFFVKWNWSKIRQSIVLINLSFLVGFLFIVAGLLIQMPRESECNPDQEWWQGTTSYHIFVPSFQDTDGNGIGDLNGIISRLDYLEELGVKTVRLAPIFETENFRDNSFSTSNYTSVAKEYGDSRDFHLLTALLHERDMYLMLDIPLARKKSDGMERESNKFEKFSPAVDLEEDVPEILSTWMKLGVDGFAFTDIQKLTDVDGFLNAFHNWRNVLDKSTRGLNRRVMMVPLTLLQVLESKSLSVLPSILNLIDMIDVHLDISQPAEDVANEIESATRWDNHASLPWINWNIGRIGHERLTDVMLHSNIYSINDGENVTVPTLGPIMLQLFLPGSVTIYYGDEIGLTQGNSSVYKNLSWASLMSWNPSSTNGGFSKGNPWLPLSSDWQTLNVASLNSTLEPLRAMIKASQTEVPLYINGIFDTVGDYRPAKATNYKIRFASGNLLIIDRFYPRRNKFAIVINLGSEREERDLSKLYYGGKVLASSHGKTGFVRFKHITLEPHEGLALILDK